jgi:DNA-binding PadR family transcriptional regulator
MKELTKAQELVLLTIWKMRDNAYGVALRRKIKENTGKDIPYGTLYFLLDQLRAKEYVQKKAGEPTPKRGGRSKTFYRITPEGKDALKEAMEMYRKVWGNVDGFAFESGRS